MSATKRFLLLAGLSGVVFAVLAVAVDRTDQHVELRELPAWQAIAVGGVFVLGSVGLYLESRYGLSSTIGPFGAMSRALSSVLAGWAVVTVLYGLNLAFR